MYHIRHLFNTKLGSSTSKGLQNIGDKNFIPGLSQKGDWLILYANLIAQQYFVAVEIWKQYILRNGIPVIND